MFNVILSYMTNLYLICEDVPELVAVIYSMPKDKYELPGSYSQYIYKSKL